MNLLRWLSVSVLALSLVPGLASADEPSLATRMQEHVDADFLKPLIAHEQETSRFSRMRMPPRERRLRMTATTTSRDASGQTFLPFAIDAKPSGGSWQENEIVGCVYTEKGGMFVKLGDSFRPSSFYLGVTADPVPGVCRAAPAPRA